MSFFSLSFPVLVAGALVIYYLLPKTWQWAFLLLLSLGFYALGGFGALGYLAFTGLTTYAAGLLLQGLNDRLKADKAAPVKGKKKLVLTLCLVLNFGLLFAVKYWGFTAAGLNRAFGLQLPSLGLLMPLGLSFYMFQSVGYAVDCYRGKQKAEKNPLKYLLFVSFFPQMVQGPISRYHELAPQLLSGRDYDPDKVKSGVQLAMWGYLKKLILADRAAVAVQTVFGSPASYGGALYAFAVLLYCVQLYCDFSGGIDITRGVARMFGIDLAENFRRPIFALSLADYWRRWHITLGAWMRDYVFYPLSFSKPFAALNRRTRKRFGGKLGKVIPTAAATFVVYLIIGIWHGANFRYLFFGLYNGVILTSSILLANGFSKTRSRLGVDDKTPWFRAFRLLRTMAIVFVGRYITRAPRLLLALQMLWKTLTSPCLYQLRDGTLLRLGLGGWDYGVLALGLAVLLVTELRQEQGRDPLQTLDRSPAFVQWLFILLPLAALLANAILSAGAIEVTLIYQQF